MNLEIKMEAQEKNIELKSEKIQEIIGHVPNWIIRRGTAVFLITLSLILIYSWFIHYPDVVAGRIIISTENPPASIIAKTNGKVAELLVRDKEKVVKGQLLGVIENTANRNDVQILKIILDSLENSIFKDSAVNTSLYRSLNLGSLQVDYADFLTAYVNYSDFYRYPFDRQKIGALNDEINTQRNLISVYRRQVNLVYDDYILSEKQFKKDSTLFSKKITSESEYDNAKSKLIQKKQLYQNSSTTLIQEQLKTIQLEESLIGLKASCFDRENAIKHKLKETYGRLKSHLLEWEAMYLLKAPIAGNVAFTKIWSVNQNVTSGTRILTVIPDKPGEMVGTVSIQQTNAGKLKKNAKVNVRLDHFPYMEYGLVVGKVKSISSTPEEGLYIVKVVFPDSLKTSYNKRLNFSQEMAGNADIITEDIRLLEHFIKPIKSLFKNN